ncbi:MAG: Capsule polysaccharide export protein [Candidatus Ozemobacter sibiricus]|uniref:Capsule polysaccharide export protein n=1 Tax=Candidatus Ozemobacter sibiricus TaxID=2268124 RepID=A0A367ZRJ6_9BACT|nr:MAG: Capsule polysaccharide export protein [Candidatus Ozemobacter sibiricus]
MLCLWMVLLACAPAARAQETLGPGDRIRIWVKGEPELTVERVLDANGAISYPLLGSVEIGGRSPVEAARLIAKALDDGYLREPLVQVNLLSRPRSTIASPGAGPASREPAGAAPSAATSGSVAASAGLPSPCPIEIVDSKTGRGIGGAAMLLGGKIYQSNRLGQVVVDQPAGRIILLADGYNVLQGPLEEFVQVGPPHRLPLTPVALAEEVTVKVVDAETKQPLADVEVRLDQMKIRTNSKGVFKVREIKREFAEVKLTRKGYKPTRKLLDFKDPLEQVILMVRNE